MNPDVSLAFTSPDPLTIRSFLMCNSLENPSRCHFRESGNPEQGYLLAQV